MLKKFTQNIWEREVMPRAILPPKPVQPAEETESVLSSQFPSFSSFSQARQESYEDDIPDVHIAENAKMKGEISFPKLLTVEGEFEGELVSSGKIVIGPKALVKADIHLKEAYISGKVEGDIVVAERLVLRGRAEIQGNITAPLISVDEGVSIIGQLNVVKKTEELPEEESTAQELDDI